MGDLDIRIRHGGGSSRAIPVVVTVIGGLGLAAGASGLLAAAETALIWIASVTAVAAAAAVALAIRAMRRGWRPNYLRSVHGDSPRNALIEENARLREEIRAMRTREELEEMMGMPITAWQARVLHQVLQEGGPRRFVTGRQGLYQQVPPIPGDSGP